jgi:hypothetical protein
LPGDDLGQRWKSKPGKRHPKTFTRADDRLQRATRRPENSVDAVVCGQLHIRSTRLRDG